MWTPWDDELTSPSWMRPVPVAGQQRAPIQPLGPQEEDSLLGKIASAGLGGLGYVGGVLEKTFGGRALRGVLGGKPREALSILPFSDTLGITDEADRVSGKDLLGFDKNDDSWGSTLAGIGTELALDPSMYLSFGAGAIGKGGQVAKKIGALPGTTTGRMTGTLDSILAKTPALAQAAEDAAGGAQALAGLRHEPLGGLFGVGLPFSHPSALVGTGQAGADFLSGAGKVASTIDAGLRAVPMAGGMYGHTMDMAGSALDTVGRYGRAMFDPSVMGRTSHLGQGAAGEAWGGIRGVITNHETKAAQYADVLKQAGIDPTGEILRAVAEGTHTGPVHPAIQKVADSMRQDLADTLGQMQGLGVNVGALDDMAINYLPRGQTPLTKPSPGYGRPQQALATADPRLASREEILKNIPGGTAGINEMILDPMVYQGNNLQAAAHIRGKYLPQGQPLGDALDQSERLVNWVRSLDPQYQASIGTANPLRYFSNHPLTDYSNYYGRAARLLGSSEATQNMLARAAFEPGAGTLPAGTVSLTDALQKAGLTHDSMIQVGGAASHTPGAQAAALERINALRQAQGQAALAMADLANLHVPGDVVSEATGLLRPFSAPESVSRPMHLFDAATNWTKALQTAPWIPFHVRNFASGLWQNAAKDMGAAEGGFGKQVADAYRLGKGEVLQDANAVRDLAHLTPEEATKTLAREMYAHGVGGHLPHLGRDVMGPNGQMVSGGTDLDTFLSRIPGEKPQGVADALGKLGTTEGQAWNPLNVQGVATNADLFAPVAAGRAMGDVIEGTNRGSLYLSLRRQGWTPEAAAQEVLGAHFDYTRMGKTDVERNVLSRVIPFYTYARQNIPAQVQQIMQHPGGMAGTATRVAGDLRQDAGFLPDYLGSGLAIPTGEEEDGVRRYLTRLDLPPEQAFEMLKGGPHWLQNSLMGLMGQTNPLLKAPLEYATGKQFFTGRDLGDLYQMTGSSTMDQMLMNSPFSRAATTLRTLTDPRKLSDPLAALAIPTNLLTGAKVTDVDVEKQRNIAAREYVKEVTQGLPEFSKFETLYTRPGMEQFLSPEEWLLLRLNKTVEEKARRAAGR